MNRRLVRPLVYVLVAAQLLLSAPAVTAMASTVGIGAAAKMPCADSMPTADDSKPCPCCPDGTTSMAGCLSACTASAATLPTLSIQIPQAAAMPVIAIEYPDFAALADPPLKPPPIF